MGERWSTVHGGDEVGEGSDAGDVSDGHDDVVVVQNESGVRGGENPLVADDGDDGNAGAGTGAGVSYRPATVGRVQR
ncbi:MAG TPA: hypothetical protein VF755_15125 [Catenuloplanes sp.]|jgi:hypothetical protein